MWRRFGTKFNNRYTYYNGNKYRSKLEASHAQRLDLMLKTGLIKSYRYEVPKPIVVNGVAICKYLPDFEVTYPDGHIEYHECKGRWTNDARLKVKLFRALYKERLEIITAKSSVIPYGTSLYASAQQD